MSNQEKQDHEPAKKAPQVTAQHKSEPKPRKRRGFFGQLFSHLMVAIIAVIGVAAYMHWSDILKYTGSRVCSYNVLGKYAGQSPKVPPIDLKKSEADQSQKQQIPAEQKPQAESLPPPAASKTLPSVESFAARLEAARKLFWAHDPSTAVAYEKLIEENPDNVDLQAELGNVHFKFGRKQQAAQMYLQAGKQFAKQKNTAKVAEMIKTLERFAPEKARELVSVDVKNN